MNVLSQILSAAANAWTGLNDFQQAFYLSGVATPSQITADQNDYGGLSTNTVMRLSSDAARSITGLAGGAAGRVALVHNVWNFPITLVKESASSTAGNRFAFDVDLILAPSQSTLLWYDTASSRWRRASASELTGVGKKVSGTNTGTITVNSTTPVNITNHSYTIAAGEEWLSYHDLEVQGNTNGINFQVTAPAGSTIILSAKGNTSGLTADTFDRQNVVNNTVATTVAAYFTASTFVGTVRVRVRVIATNAGTVQLKAKTASGTNSSTVQSYGEMEATRKV
jgi:hypothetical protein